MHTVRFIPLLFCPIIGLLAPSTSAGRIYLSYQQQDSSHYTDSRFDLLHSSRNPSVSAPEVLGDSGPKASVKYEIRYAARRAETVRILWGLNGWKVPGKAHWPQGAQRLSGYPFCNMEKQGEDHVIVLTVPETSTLDYCFNIVSPSRHLNTWDVNGGLIRDYHSMVIRNGTAMIIGNERPPQNVPGPLNQAVVMTYIGRYLNMAAVAVLLLCILMSILRRRAPMRAV